MKQEIYQRVSKINDRAFSLVTIFVMSISLTAIDLSFHFVDKSTNLLFAFSALAALVITSMLYLAAIIAYIDFPSGKPITRSYNLIPA